MEGLLAPAWVVALATACYMGAMAVVKIKANGNGNGSYGREISTALQSATRTLDALAIRLEQLPTREDISSVAEKNRHDNRNALQSTQGAITNEITRSEQNLARLIERQA